MESTKSTKNDWPSPDGWFSPKRKGYQFKCCKCGIVHVIDFRINNTYEKRNIIQMRINLLKKWKKNATATSKDYGERI